MTGFAATPRDQADYRQSFAEYQEAVAEVADAYAKPEANHDPVREPDYFKAAVADAKAKGAKLNA